ncbi:TetR/AcrR family transcriptional regulator C-terminal domain-containing protein [Actinoplanes sp. NEAU-A12]|uniref:TetR/AcrR family transcriptional regulator C-terminal domain-containing protein n=1 Tax=Actinoplanes sandaracinus TaxID=3045177 RepID=A0ABT6WKK6_9ACTN|nr:TetR/AcrR family transcriptional regulator C-terminal domain-containing protein [Actinoplanes sandaracinus]MDI6100268.1 TetR/AcrR family transcriptional regulator C-terminal domain-containing protein [Actinoplanes sandaracinus]
MARPATPKLSVEKIAGAALAIVDSKGDFTLGEVAAALSVRPSSIYNHVTGRTEIIEAMRALIFTEDPAAALPHDWDDALRALLRRYRDAFARHPRLIPMLTAHTVSSPDVVHMYDDIATVLHSAGIPTAQLLDVITVLDSFVIGSALDIAAPDQVWDPTHARTPVLVAAIEAAGQGRERADRAFELGLGLILGALATLPARTS